MSHKPRHRLLWLGAGLLAVLCCGRAWFSPENPLPTGADTFRYPGLIEKWRAKGAGWADHFPDEIPDGVTDVEVRALIGVLQANSVLRLRYTTSPSDAERTIARFRDRAIFRCSAGKWVKADGTRADGSWPSHILGVALERTDSLELVVLGPIGVEVVDSDYLCGVAVDHVTGDVWFWAEHP